MKRVFVWIVGALVGCVILGTLLFNTWEPSPIAHEYLVGNENCTAPCWNGIIPDETSYEEARPIVENLEFANSDGYVIFNDDSIVWGSGNRNNVGIYTEDGIVYLILLKLVDVDLGSLVNKYGEPDGYLFHPDNHESYGISIFYPDIGLVFKSSQAKNPISEEGNVTEVMFLSPGSSENFYNQYLSKIRILFPHFPEEDPEYYNWEGFDLCPLPSSDNFCD